MSVMRDRRHRHKLPIADFNFSRRANAVAGDVISIMPLPILIAVWPPRCGNREYDLRIFAATRR